MSYIESHQDLEGHFKLLDLMAAMHLDKHAAIGLLHCFWWWSLTYAESGLLAKHPPARLDAKFGKGFVEAMMTARFIDRKEYRIHNWGKRASRYLLTRYRTRQPLYVARIFLEYGMLDEATQLLTQAVTLNRVTKAQADQALAGKGPPLDSLIEKAPTHEKKAQIDEKTVENSCEQAPKVALPPAKTPVSSGNSSHLNSAQPGAAQLIPSNNASSSDGEGASPDSQPPGFKALWDAYPRPSARKTALRAWEKLAPDDAKQRIILEKLAAQKLARAAREKAGLFTPNWTNLSTYLSGERWEDVIQLPPPGSPEPAEGPPNGEPYQPRSPLQQLICVYKMIKIGLDGMEDRGWDESNWRGAEPHAKNLLKAFDGDSMAAGAWLEGFAQEMQRGGFENWTLRAAAERAWNTKGARQADRPINLTADRGKETMDAAAILDTGGLLN